jgi:hypothetical protein
MSKANTVSPLRQRMTEDMAARKLGPQSQRSHIHSCRRFAAFLKRSPDTATADDIRRFQLHLIESGVSICNRNRIMTGVRFLFRVTLRRHDLAAEIYHLKEPQKLPLIMSPEEIKRLLLMARSLKVRVILAMAVGCVQVRSLASSPTTSIARRCSSVSSNQRAARTGMSCCRRRCSRCCVNGGRSAPRATTLRCPSGSVGYFQGVGWERISPRAS